MNTENELNQVIKPLISISARLALGKALTEIYEICENQKTIKTSKLIDIVDSISNQLKNESVYIRNQANKLIKYNVQ